MKLISDRYNGLTIDSTSIPSSIKNFEKELLEILNNNKETNLLWIKIPIEKSDFIPFLTKYEFVFHHCNENDITLLKKLTIDPIVPTAKNHTLGVGAVVIDGDELLVIKDRFNIGYKLPGGHIDDNENISNALVREVLEETGVIVNMKSIVSLGHFTQAQFGESNLYVVCTAVALSKKIDIQDTDEILEAKWIKVNDFLADSEVLNYNKKLVSSALNSVGLVINKTNLLPNKENELFS